MLTRFGMRSLVTLARDFHKSWSFCQNPLPLAFLKSCLLWFSHHSPVIQPLLKVSWCPQTGPRLSLQQLPSVSALLPQPRYFKEALCMLFLPLGVQFTHYPLQFGFCTITSPRFPPMTSRQPNPAVIFLTSQQSYLSSTTLSILIQSPLLLWYHILLASILPYWQFWLCILCWLLFCCPTSECHSFPGFCPDLLFLAFQTLLIGDHICYWNLNAYYRLQFSGLHH